MNLYILTQYIYLQRAISHVTNNEIARTKCVRKWEWALKYISKSWAQIKTIDSKLLFIQVLVYHYSIVHITIQ